MSPGPLDGHAGPRNRAEVTMILSSTATRRVASTLTAVSVFIVSLLSSAYARAQQIVEDTPRKHGGGEANLVLPDLDSVQMLGMTGKSLLMWGLIVTSLGLVFGVVTLRQVRDLPA